jgi:GNAT superfamily N-acetyltransferase
VVEGNGVTGANGSADPSIEVCEVVPGTSRFEAVRTLAARLLGQDRYLQSVLPAALESHVLGAFAGPSCAGFLRYVIQVIGVEAGRPPVLRSGVPLTEGYVEAFGVAPRWRRRGIGTALQDGAAGHCRIAGCYQMRSRSPATSTENYALKIAAGYVLHPSEVNDSYYFLLHL